MSATPTHQHTKYIQDILNVCNVTPLTERADGEPVTTITVTIPEVDVARWTPDCKAIVSIEDDIILE